MHAQTADVFALTECKTSDGCAFLERSFLNCGYHVVASRPETREYGVLIASRFPLRSSKLEEQVDFLPFRTASVIFNDWMPKLELILTYVPSRDASIEKITKKRRFLASLEKALRHNHNGTSRIFCGDLNILEPGHDPHYPFFEEWEYGFYSSLADVHLIDAFRHLNPDVRDYSWVGRTGDGYRYDHTFVSSDLLAGLTTCEYEHLPRNKRLSDHSALITSIRFPRMMGLEKRRLQLRPYSEMNTESDQLALW